MRVERVGYVSVERQVTLTDTDVTLDITLEKKYSLTVNVTPLDSTISIVNPNMEYKPGIALAPGRYDVQVKREGYKTVRQWVTLTDTDVTLDITLELTSQIARPKTLRNTIGMEFVLIPSGEFMMGSNNGWDREQPVHKVTISQPFYLGKYEVTQAQWKVVMGTNPSRFTDDPNLPVENASWEDVQKFIRRLNAIERGTKYRLPTEAEWEYGARAGPEGTRYHTDVDAIAWYSGNSNRKTHAVGQKLPNAWGLYDMHGNVWEWVQDWYAEEYYQRSPTRDPQGPDEGASRMIRGGSWNFVARDCRAAIRYNYAPDFRGYYLGFRLARSVALGS